MRAVRFPPSFTAVPLLLSACSGLVACGADAATDAKDAGPLPTATDAGAPGSDASSAPDAAGTPPPPASCTGKTGAVGDRTVKITSDGKERSFDLHVPANVDGQKPVSLVFLFHGYTMTAEQIATASHFAKVADARGFIVAVPSGTLASFNGGTCCGTAASSKTDDVQFTRDMITKISAEHCVDPKRIFSTGFSNGGFMSYRLACDLSDVIAAIAPVAGVLGQDPATCNPKRAVPLMHVHGTGDLLVPYNGGGIANYPSVASTIDAWRSKNGSAAGPGQNVFTKDDVSCTQWSGTADVRLCTVTDGGHQWPGGSSLPYGGSPTPNLDASEAIAAFFEAHPMP
jgi:polyhydroxybutyrate depolymerase